MTGRPGGPAGSAACLTQAARRQAQGGPGVTGSSHHRRNAVSGFKFKLGRGRPGFKWITLAAVGLGWHVGDRDAGSAGALPDLQT